MSRLLFPPALLAVLLGSFLPAQAAPLDRSTFTEVINRVTVIDSATRKSRPAKTSEVFTAPDVLRTGADSRAELVADDHTVTRVGSNTIFSFSRDSRELELQKGAILFQPQPGKGGGSIRTPAASAAVLGTTIIVAATPDGGMKVLLIEGKGKVVLPGGQSLKLTAGQMVIIHNRVMSQVLDFRLQDEVMNAKLIRGFHVNLPSQPKIARAELAQRRDIQQGRLGPGGNRPPPPPGFPPPPPPPPPRGTQQPGGGIPPPPPKDSGQKPPPPPPRTIFTPQPQPTSPTPTPARRTGGGGSTLPGGSLQ